MNNASFEWLCFNHQKPGRKSKPSLVAHTTPTWAEQHFDQDAETLKQELVTELGALLQQDLDPNSAMLHRWRYGRTVTPLGQDFWHNPDHQMIACGDWCLGSGIEDAYRSAIATAEFLAQHYK